MSTNMLLSALVGAVLGALAVLAVTPRVPSSYPTPVQVCSYLAVHVDANPENGAAWDPTKRLYQQRDCPSVINRAMETP